MSSKDKWVRRFSIDETAKHKNGFTIYKITSVLFPLHSPEAVTVVTLWKRYSDVQQLHKSMKSLHAGLHLRGRFPDLVKGNYFKRFDPEVIEERAKTIKNVLEFIAEHRLLFTSTDFVNFLQSGYPAPGMQQAPSVIDAIRSTLRLSLEEVPSVVHDCLDDIISHDTTDHSQPVNVEPSQQLIVEPNRQIIVEPNKQILVEPNKQILVEPSQQIQSLDSEISKIPIYLPFDIEFKKEQTNLHRKLPSDESLASIESLKDDLYDDINKICIEKPEKFVKKIVLPDLINFDQPSTSKFDDIHTIEIDKKIGEMESVKIDTESVKIDTESVKSDLDSKFTDTFCETDSLKSNINRSESKISLISKKSMFSIADLDIRSRTESSYIFEAGHLLNLAARSEEGRLFQKAFDLYKAGIEILLIGVKDDPDVERKALIKEKINKYLCYAEAIHKQHLTNVDSELLPRPPARPPAPPRGYLPRCPRDLNKLRVVSLLSGAVMLVYSEQLATSAALKVIQKIPNNLTDFDDNYLSTVNETKTPILPSNVPYMVTLHFYIEMKNLFFLVLSYAPGEKLFDYIRNYAKVKNTKSRKSNIENVFIEPKCKPQVLNENLNDLTNDNSEKITKKYYNFSDIEKSISDNQKNIISKNDIDTKNDNKKTDTDLSVNDLVLNSQKLLQNVDKALKDSRNIDSENQNDTERNETDISGNDIDMFVDENDINNENVQIEIVDKECVLQDDIEKSSLMYKGIAVYNSRDVLPPATICKWGAEILTALEALHDCGVVCRDLNPNNILLSANGQITLTYFVGYNEWELTWSQIERQVTPHGVSLYIAPELYEITFGDEERRPDDHLCDYWSFGAIMFELICGLPLSHFHNSVFTSHTILQTPDGLDYEALSLLTQLLSYSPRSRLGANGIHEIKLHPYFKHIDWSQTYHDWTPPT